MVGPRVLPLAVAVVAASGCLGGGGPAAPPAETGTGPVAATVTNVTLPFDVPVRVLPLPATPESPAGTLLVGDLATGRVFRVDPPASLQPEPIIDLPSSAPDGEYGLLGLALHPAYPSEPWVYAFFTDPPSAAAHRFQRIVRFAYAPGDALAGAPQDVVTGLTTGAACCHNGGRVAFGPDGMLYATLGDNMAAPLAQLPHAPPGSVLRYTPTGQVPADNPFPGSPVAVLGIRNAFGLHFDPEWGMVVTDNGPSTFDGPGGLDEVNLLRVGDNAGWPLSRGDLVLPGHVKPLWHSGDVHLAPTGVAVPRASLRPDWDGLILWCTVNDGFARMLDPSAPNPQPRTVAAGCRYDVAQDALGRLIFADDARLVLYG